MAARLNLRRNLATLQAKMSKEALSDPAVQDATALRYDGDMDIVHIQYIPTPDQVSSSDAEFSRSSIARRSEAGYEDMKHAIEQSPWSAKERPRDVAAVVHTYRAGGMRQHAPMT